MNWKKVNPQYPEFQVAAWDNEVTGKTLVVEKAIADRFNDWRTVLLGPDQDPVPQETVAELNDKGKAIEAAARFMGDGT